MEDIAQAFSEFANAQRIMSWMADNGYLKEGVDIGQVAFGFAISYASPKVVEAFRQAALLELADRERIAAQPKRRRALTDQENQEEIDRMERERDTKRHAQSLAVLMANVETKES
jgi:hypothetical protein